MSGSGAEALDASCSFDEGEALPQRQPRTKRRREETTAVQQSSDAAAAPAQQDSQAEAASQPPEDDATPANNQLKLREYRSAAVPGLNFECAAAAAACSCPPLQQWTPLCSLLNPPPPANWLQTLTTRPTCNCMHVSTPRCHAPVPLLLATVTSVPRSAGSVGTDSAL